jgi:hypothetical protein
MKDPACLLSLLLSVLPLPVIPWQPHSRARIANSRGVARTLFAGDGHSAAFLLGSIFTTCFSSVSGTLEVDETRNNQCAASFAACAGSGQQETCV